MSTRISIAVLGLIVILSSLSEMRAQSYEHVRTIRFQDGATKKRSVKSFIFGKKRGKGIKPSAICRLDDDLICVTDAVNGVILVADEKGKVKKKITRVRGIRILSPVSACTDDRGSLYVADSAQGGVIRFNRSHKFEDIFIASMEWRITGIVFIKGRFYCVDSANHQVLCFDRQGRLRFSFGKRGSGKGQFNFPTHITADRDHIYITDAMNFRVQVFDHSGQFVRAFGKHGRGGANFSKPKGIAVDKEKRIFVTDAMFDNVQVFNFTGEFLDYFGRPGHQKEEFWMPAGIMVDTDNTIWVADTYNQRIQVFKLVEDAT